MWGNIILYQYSNHFHQDLFLKLSKEYSEKQPPDQKYVFFFYQSWQPYPPFFILPGYSLSTHIHRHICHHLSCQIHEEIASFSYGCLYINYSCDKGKLGLRLCGKKTTHAIYLFHCHSFDAFWCQRKTRCFTSLILNQIASQHLRGHLL